MKPISELKKEKLQPGSITLPHEKKLQLLDKAFKAMEKIEKITSPVLNRNSTDENK